jgi:hypothetical protein
MDPFDDLRGAEGFFTHILEERLHGTAIQIQ